MFEQALLAGPRGTARSVTFAASMGVQMAALCAAVVVPLFLVQGPSIVRLNSSVMAPPAPPPPPAPMKLVDVPKRVRGMFQNARLFAYTHIPDKISRIIEATLPDDAAPSLSSGRGVPGGTGFENAWIGRITTQTPPPPAEKSREVKQESPEKPVTRIRTSSGVQAAKIIHRVLPVYPPLAKAARISGTVKLMGIINREGRIMQLQVISGHPLLVAAAVDAVRQWAYQPTLLSGEPVEVIAPIEVNFTLSQ